MPTPGSNGDSQRYSRHGKIAAARKDSSVQIVPAPEPFPSSWGSAGRGARGEVHSTVWLCSAGTGYHGGVGRMEASGWTKHLESRSEVWGCPPNVGRRAIGQGVKTSTNERTYVATQGSSRPRSETAEIPRIRWSVAAALQAQRVRP